MGIGEKLKEIRESKGFSLDEIQEETKIQKRYLRAIEDGNFHILPGSFYARAFIKEYAQALGLDYEELLEEHKDELPSIGERRSEAQYTQIQRTRKSSDSSKSTAVFSFIPTVIVLLLIMIIIGLAIYFIQQKSFTPENNNEPNEVNEFYRQDGNNKDNEDNESNNDGNPADNNVENNDEDNEENNNENNNEEPTELEFQVGGTDESVSPPVTTYELTHGDLALELVVEASDKSWLDIDADEERIFSGFVESGNTPLDFDVSDADQLVLNIGNASFVDVIINDVKLEYEIDKNQHVFQKIIITINEDE